MASISKPLSLANDSTLPFSVWSSLILHNQNKESKPRKRGLFSRDETLMREANLAISARLFASSAMRLMSLKVFLSWNVFVSADWRPCSVRCSAAHAAERASFPKSFLLVKAVYKNRKDNRIKKFILKFAKTCRGNYPQVVWQQWTFRSDWLILYNVDIIKDV